MGSVRSCSDCLVPEGWSPWPCCHLLEHRVVGQNLGKWGAAALLGGRYCHQRRHWGRAQIREQGGTPPWGWGSDPWHPQLSDGASIQASWCVLGHPGTFWGVF